MSAIPEGTVPFCYYPHYGMFCARLCKEWSENAKVCGKTDVSTGDFVMFPDRQVFAVVKVNPDRSFIAANLDGVRRNGFIPEEEC